MYLSSSNNKIQITNCDGPCLSFLNSLLTTSSVSFYLSLASSSKKKHMKYKKCTSIEEKQSDVNSMDRKTCRIIPGVPLS
jgi:hypothetical protein